MYATAFLIIQTTQYSGWLTKINNLIDAKMGYVYIVYGLA